MSKRISLVDRILLAAWDEEDRIVNYNSDSLQRRYIQLNIVGHEIEARRTTVRLALNAVHHELKPTKGAKDA